ncbi:class I SAM-dependent methyltransferase [Azorhizobium doebereinerae]|uniref:class I SAM-dependent methyltransferase n=1 Tax=Azorhizobium doebereinerae TaxID=281091 RepID=UPI0003FA1D1D|nr:class I SAM-dependent methyltransferase [Azorhizobium doebereinerae]
MQDIPSIAGYRYASAEPSGAHAYLLPCLARILDEFERQDTGHQDAGRRLIDVGCGNGAVTQVLAARGYDVVGIDPSQEGIAQANRAYPHLAIHQGSAYDDLAATYGVFDVVVSLEVVEHLYDPRRYARVIFDLLKPGGLTVLSTPYHSYLKNLALAASGRMDAHFTALWDHGHIKFWSRRTLAALLRESGFPEVTYHRVGRVPFLAKSMVAVTRKPLS